MAHAVGDRATADWATGLVGDLEQRFEQAWWFGGETAALLQRDAQAVTAECGAAWADE
jgi:hypothetical protein